MTGKRTEDSKSDTIHQLLQRKEKQHGDVDRLEEQETSYFCLTALSIHQEETE
jgi:hypothetical protein